MAGKQQHRRQQKEVLEAEIWRQALWVPVLESTTSTFTDLKHFLVLVLEILQKYFFIKARMILLLPYLATLGLIILHKYCFYGSEIPVFWKIHMKMR